MRAFPMFIKTTGRRVVILGGGEQAAQKTRLILKTDADIVLAAPQLDPELAAVVASGRARHHSGAIRADLFQGAAMVFIATGCPGADAALHGVAQSTGAPVNVVDAPDLCDITTPALVDRDPVVIAIGTEGTAPVLARQIKTRIEQELEQNLGGLAALAGRLRGAVARQVPRSRRRAFWRWVFDGAPRRSWVRGAESRAAEAIKAALAEGQAPGVLAAGSIALISANPKAPDLLTLRAVQRLQEADVIFHDGPGDAPLLELARRDAERVSFRAEGGAHTWPDDRIAGRLLAEARQGRRVVRLIDDDVAAVDRCAADLAAAETVGVAVEIVPSVASSAPAPSRQQSRA